MRNLFPVIFAEVLIIVFGIVQLLFLKFFNREWWRRRGIRTVSWMLPLIGIVAVVMWGYGEYTARDWLTYPGAVLAMLTFMAEVCLIVSLPLSGLFHAANWLLDKVARSQSENHRDEHMKSRRAFLKGAAAAVPLVTLATGATGVAAAMIGARVYVKEIIIHDLPAHLEGMRILHLSDIHLRHHVTLDDLTDVLTAAAPFKPDIVLVTGDVADDLKVLPEALKLISELDAPLGAWACLGNHEYFRGIGQVRRIYDKSPVPLLVNKGTSLEMGAGRLFIAGLDDPRMMRSLDADFFPDSLKEALNDVATEEFILVMSHRPYALNYAPEKGVNLILAGHTHGGQVGVNNRSIFESALHDSYLWGHYQRGNSHLYTSSGTGHWFPFRLGCPPEAPVIELRGSLS